MPFGPSETSSLRKRTCRAALIAACVPAIASAQSIRGVVVDGGSTPLSGVIVMLLDSATHVAARGLTNERGEFRVVAPRTGRYKARTQRIGYAPITSDEFTLADKQPVVKRFVMNGLQILLDTIRVAERSSCAGFTDSASATFAAWEQIRTALSATQLTDAGGRFRSQIVSYRKTLDAPGRRLLSQQQTVNEQSLSRTWQSLPPDRLHRAGYVITEPDGAVNYYAPGLETLLSEQFVQDHCFRVDKKRDAILVVFESVKERENIPEIRGTLTLDRRTSELQKMDFRYENIPSEMHDEAVGLMEFAHLRGGDWVISRWSIRMPVFERVLPSRNGTLARLININTVGGELVLAQRGGDTLLARPPITVKGRIVDSLSGRPVGSAEMMLEGTSLNARTNNDGEFAIPNAYQGHYMAMVVLSAGDSAASAYEVPMNFVDDKPIDVSVSPAWKTDIVNFGGTVSGWILEDTTHAPISLARIYVDSGPAAVTNDRGEFRLADVPPGKNTIQVRRLGYAPIEISLTVAPFQTVVRRVLLNRIQVLPEVATVGSPNRYLREFDENRKIGLGQFLDRKDLEKNDGRLLSVAIQNMRGVRLRPGKQFTEGSKALEGSGKLFLESLHAGPAFSGKNCNAQVYLDGMYVNRPVARKKGWLPNPVEPFDLNQVQIDELEAIEYYASAAETPAKYMEFNSGCGVLVLWTRRTVGDLKP